MNAWCSPGGHGLPPPSPVHPRLGAHARGPFPSSACSELARLKKALLARESEVSKRKDKLSKLEGPEPRAKTRAVMKAKKENAVA